jgi:hypothetical protein
MVEGMGLAINGSHAQMNYVPQKRFIKSGCDENRKDKSWFGRKSLEQGTGQLVLQKNKILFSA